MLKLLAVGDLHLGRRPARLPVFLADRARELGPNAAWRVVDEAVQNQIHVVALAGDVVEREDDFFEAYRALSAGVKRLTEVGIEVVGVAGNHDVQVLPRLVAELPGFRLLGRGGCWEKHGIEAAGEQLTLWGWSFNRDRAEDNPLAGQQFERGPGVNLGLLHCDRDQSHSPYAPVRSSELEQAGLDGWLLGHIHQPDKLTPDRPIGYLGSITGLDPTETGPRGPWLLTIEAGRIASVEHWALAPLRWEHPAVDLSDIRQPEEAKNRLVQRLEQLDTELAVARLAPAAVGLRIRLVGSTRWGAKAAELLDPHLQRDQDEPVFTGRSSGADYFIDRVELATRPEIDLDKLAERADPPGLLARRLLLLGRSPDDPQRQQLLAQARKALQDCAEQPHWRQLNRPPLSDEEAAEYLRRAGLAILSHLLARRDDHDAAR